MKIKRILKRGYKVFKNFEYESDLWSKALNDDLIKQNLYLSILLGDLINKENYHSFALIVRYESFGIVFCLDYLVGRDLHPRYLVIRPIEVLRLYDIIIAENEND